MIPATARVYRKYAHHDNQGGGNTSMVNWAGVSFHTPSLFDPFTKNL